MCLTLEFNIFILDTFLYYHCWAVQVLDLSLIAWWSCCYFFVCALFEEPFDQFKCFWLIISYNYLCITWPLNLIIYSFEFLRPSIMLNRQYFWSDTSIKPLKIYQIVSLPDPSFKADYDFSLPKFLQMLSQALCEIT